MVNVAPKPTIWSYGREDILAVLVAARVAGQTFELDDQGSPSQITTPLAPARRRSTRDGGHIHTSLGFAVKSATPNQRTDFPISSIETLAPI